MLVFSFLLTSVGDNDNDTTTIVGVAVDLESLLVI